MLDLIPPPPLWMPDTSLIAPALSLAPFMLHPTAGSVEKLAHDSMYWGNSGTSKSHTIAAGTDALIGVVMAVDQSEPLSSTQMTYGGSPMAKEFYVDLGVALPTVIVFSLAAPASGSQTWATSNSYTMLTAHAVLFDLSGADPTNRIDQYSTGTVSGGTSMNASITPNSSTGLIVSAASVTNNVSGTISTDYDTSILTLFQQVVSFPGCTCDIGLSTIDGGSQTHTTSWTGSQSGAIAVAEVKPA